MNNRLCCLQSIPTVSWWSYLPKGLIFPGDTIGYNVTVNPLSSPSFWIHEGHLGFWIPEIFLQQKMACVSSFCDPSFTLVDASPEAAPAMADPRASQEVIIEFRHISSMPHTFMVMCFLLVARGDLEIKNECF